MTPSPATVKFCLAECSSQVLSPVRVSSCRWRWRTDWSCCRKPTETSAPPPNTSSPVSTEPITPLRKLENFGETWFGSTQLHCFTSPNFFMSRLLISSRTLHGLACSTDMWVHTLKHTHTHTHTHRVCRRGTLLLNNVRLNYGSPLTPSSLTLFRVVISRGRETKRDRSGVKRRTQECEH